MGFHCFGTEKVHMFIVLTHSTPDNAGTKYPRQFTESKLVDSGGTDLEISEALGVTIRAVLRLNPQ